MFQPPELCGPGRRRAFTVTCRELFGWDEARSALLEQTDVRVVIDRRRQERLRTLANPGPQRYGLEPALPTVNRLPPPAREATEDVLWLLDLVMPVPALIQNAPRAAIAHKVIAGRAAAQGTARGPVRIVRDESEFDKLRGR